jgi:hypothetical protein
MTRRVPDCFLCGDPAVGALIVVMDLIESAERGGEVPEEGMDGYALCAFHLKKVTIEGLEQTAEIIEMVDAAALIAGEA